MKELLTQAQANGIFGVALPLIGLALGGALLALKKERHVALFVGGPLALSGLLWWVYNVITNALGLDTVLNLVVNFALFLAVGTGLGLVWRRMSPAPNTGVPPSIGGEGEL
jgi:hypothetical protein